MNNLPFNTLDRRRFLSVSSGAVVASAMGFLPKVVPAALGPTDSRRLKIGLVGCGSRGTGAANQALAADSNIDLFAVGDVFPEKIASSLGHLAKANPERARVPESRQFTGLDAYQKVIDLCDVVLLATPPGFRPQHLRAAVEARKHVFAEKPVATDAPGVRSALESAALAQKNGTALKSGFNWRNFLPMQAFMERVHSGAIGGVSVAYATYYVAVLQPIRPGEERKPGMTDLEWQLRHWYNFVWLSGDGYVEQTVHNADWVMWLMKDVPPLRCVAVGGRQVPGNGGNIFDHFEVNYEWPGGVRCFIAARQQNGCYRDQSLYVMGAKGTGTFHRGGVPEISAGTTWRHVGETNVMHQAEHDELFASIRRGEPVNDGARMARSTLCAIMGRMAAYTGQEITWEMAMNSKEQLVPDKLNWTMKLPVAPMAVPGQTKFI